MTSVNYCLLTVHFSWLQSLSVIFAARAKIVEELVNLYVLISKKCHTTPSELLNNVAKFITI